MIVADALCSISLLDNDIQYFPCSDRTSTCIEIVPPYPVRFNICTTSEKKPVLTSVDTLI